MAYTTDATRWQALATRDANADGHFIYTVKSTKIYCRPTCPGRLARRANVNFYKTAFEAEAAGFRACKRCKPNTVLEDPQERAVETACLLIDEALRGGAPNAIRLQDLADKVGLTPRYFHKIFKDRTGVTPKEYAKAKTLAQSSQRAAPVSTASEGSVSTPDWETFDFNDLTDFGAGPDVIFTDSSILRTAQGLTTGLEADTDVTVLLQPWEFGYEPNCMALDPFFVDDKLINPFETMPAPLKLLEGKDMLAVSTFELDAAALLQCDSLSDILST